MGRHDPPRTGDGKTQAPRKIGKAEVKVQRADGSWIEKCTALLWSGRNRKR